jgi:dUTPase
MIKIDPAASDLPLPARIVQLVPRPIVHFEVVESDELDDTRRGNGGFGSTG